MAHIRNLLCDEVSIRSLKDMISIFKGAIFVCFTTLFIRYTCISEARTKVLGIRCNR